METSRINFIGREEELRSLLDFVGENREVSGGAIFISGEGGIGKTRLLNEISTQIRKNFKNYAVHKIIDFDNRKFNSPEGINLAMIEEWPDYEGFNEYFDQLEDIRIIEETQVREITIEKQKQELVNTFVNHYNQCIKGKNVWLFDTVEKLSESEDEVQINKEIVIDWRKKFPRLKNTFFVFAGRNPVLDQVREQFEQDKKIDILNIELGGFLPEESWLYIKEKQEKLHLSIKKELSDKLIELAGGKPIYLDLAVEWFTQEADENELKNIITDKKSDETKNDFEEKLVSKIRELRYPIDWIVFVLAHIHPLDKEGFDILFDDDDLIKDTFESVKKIVFVKTLPNNEIKLHDEMERIVKKYIFGTIDIRLRRRQYYSQKIIDHLEKLYKIREEKYIQNSKNFVTSEDAKEILKTRIEWEEDRISLNDVTNQLITHSFYADVQAGKQRFRELIEELVSGRLNKHEVNSLLKSLDNLTKNIPLDEDVDFVLDRARLQLYAGKEEALDKYWDKASNEQKIGLNFLRSNFLVRKGDISGSIRLLEQAENINEEEQKGDSYNKIKLDIELGWNNRLIGNLEEAKKRYEEAIQLILEEVGSDAWVDHEELAIRYGWTLNNLAFVLSDSNETRRDAVDYAYSAIDHWETINHRKGLGAGHSVLGITFYRIDKSEDSFAHFEKAQEIFEELELAEWVCQIHSWRGALFQDRNKKGDLERAYKELDKALKIAEDANKQIVPMTLNRLGRVYMSKLEWGKALKTMEESLNRAKDLPDYVYWLGSIGRIGYIMAEYPESGYQLNDLWDEFRAFKKTIEKNNIQPEKNSLGITKLALARLELASFSKNKNPGDKKIEEIVQLLKDGIPLITEFGSYARTDIRSRLAHLERGFSAVDPSVIHTIGNKLHGFVKQKTKDSGKYVIVIGIINKWRNWK